MRASNTGPAVGIDLPRRAHRGLRIIIALLSLTVLAAACGEDEPEVTIEQRLAAVEGRELTEAEVAERLSTGEMLCLMEEPVLDAIWRQLNERQLNFQDVVFGQICPERSVFYAGQTGRYVTEEAENSGVVTSTTRTVPPRITAVDETPETTAPPVTTPASAATGTQTSQTTEPDTTDTTPTTTATTATTLAETTTSDTTVEGEGG